MSKFTCQFQENSRYTLYYQYIDSPESLAMDTSPALEPPLHADLAQDIEQLRTQFPRTQDLYREVCVLLFFRHGITPTANRLYQLVKKGSMNAPAEALARFWATLRDKSRVRIEHPDLPAELQSATGELAAALWMRAADMAQEQLATAQHEAQLSVADAQTRQRQAEAERDRLRQELTGSAAALDGAQIRITEGEQALAIAVAAASTFQEQVRLAQQGEHHLQQALETARRDFTSELDKLRADGALAQERLKAAETRALLEIERERQAAARLQKELDRLPVKRSRAVPGIGMRCRSCRAKSVICVSSSVSWRASWTRCASPTRVILMKRRRRVISETHWRCR